MKAKLIKEKDGRFHLWLNVGTKDADHIASNEPLVGEWGRSLLKYKLSLKNCQAIERGYDLGELTDNFYERTGYHDFDSHSYKLGFQKALEILGDRRFTEEDMRKAMDRVWEWYNDEDVIVGNTASQTVTLTNTGNANLTITSAPVTGAGFSVTGLTLPLTLTPGHASSFTARLAPSAAGAANGSISLTSNASNSPTPVTLTGNGVAQVLTVSLSPPTIDFGDVTVGATATQTVTMTNTGNFGVNVTAAKSLGPASASWALSG